MTAPRAAAALLALTLLRIAFAACIPLAPDEAYYWVWSRALQPGYFDHPPMVALWIRAGTLLLGDTPLGIRLLGPLAAAVGSILLVDAGNRLFPNRRPGIAAAALLNATLLMSAGAIVMTPDTPLLFFWTATLWALARLIAGGDGRWWLAAGGLAGLALDSKYTAALLGLGIALWLLTTRLGRIWLRRWQPWAGGALAVLLFAPVIAWNAAHGWISFAKQGGRTGSTGTGNALRFIGELIGGQLALATPLILLLCAAGAIATVPAWRRQGDPAAALLASLTLPGAILFLVQATGSRVQGNWPAILYPGAALAAAALLGPAWQRWRPAAVALGAAITLLICLQAAFAPLPLPRRFDPTLARLAGWEAFAADLDLSRRSLVPGLGFIAAEEYGLAAELALRLPPGVPVIAIDPRWALFALPAPPLDQAGLLVRSERRGSVPPLWPNATPLGDLARARDGIEAERYRLYRVVTRPDAPANRLLPRPDP